ncbi:spook isoform X2 [Arctopsyche grandis]|uniref:spook isoform X2 n=1 Tax=Arctopsyche grandis TaxID=121162 RepID=UPI00406D9270
MIAIFIPIVLILISVYALKVWKTGKDKDTGSNIVLAPGPKPFPIIGSAHLLSGSESPFVKMTELSNIYGDILSITIGATKCVVVSSVETIRSVLLQNGKYFDGRPNFMRFHKLFADNRQNSLALCDWCNLQAKRRNISRRHCDPGTQSPLKNTISDVGALEMKELVSTLKKKGTEAFKQGVDLELKPIIMSTTLNLFSQYMCSLRFDTDDAEFKNIVDLFDNIFWDINQGHPVDFFPYLAPFFGKDMNKLSTWSTTIRKFILSRIINMRELTLDDEDEEKDFTDALLKSLKYETLFTKEAILFTLEDFLGGSSAVGNLVMLMLGFIAKNPEVGVKMQKEIDEVSGGQRALTIFDVDSLPYTMATINETLRRCSSPIVPHVASQSGNVKGYTIEKGTVILINNYKMNMNEKLWENPMEFRPERFLNKSYIEVKNERRGSDHDSGVESESESKKKAKIKTNLPHFMPFSIGKRTCLGRNLLMDYSFVICTTIMQNFNVSCKHPENIKMYTACVALPPQTYGLTITPRKR